jgi:hypothetical protein
MPSESLTMRADADEHADLDKWRVRRASTGRAS